MAFKLLDLAEKRWRCLDGRHLLPLVRAGVTFVDGLRQDRTTNPITESIDNQPKEAA